jgi:serine/threonine-protein kinase
MNEPHDPNRTVDVPSSIPADSLDAGLAAGFGRAAPPRSSLGDLRPVLLKQAEGESDHVVKPKSDAMPSREVTGDRYRLDGEIARGGMGAVLRGRDMDLGRDLAVKVLLPQHAGRPEVARRFVEEAQIGGQLQHPGVVPVYDVGRFGDRPFFTMKLVKGQTLAALLGERAEPAAERPRLLAIALQVAQAVAYAHAKGVIHRDLKPANVMVGAFGEVQVMDWGLAKVLAEGGLADEERTSRQQQHEEGTLIRTARSAGAGAGTVTEAGSLLGTPAYMPPEQANGDVALLDRRCDVFGLGAILCEVLTGKPPYVGRSSEEVRRKACNGDLAGAYARLEGCGVDAELIGLTRACLAAEAIDRPRDAQAVAESVQAHLDGVQERLRRAELAGAAEAARAEEARATASQERKAREAAQARGVAERRARRLTLALAATVLLAVILGGGGWLYLKGERDARQAQVARDVNEALNRATALRAQAQAAPAGGAALLAQAREQAQRARALLEGGPADAALAARVRRLQTDLDEEEKDRKLVAALDEARLKQAETLSENRYAVERAVPLFREAFRAYGMAAGEGDPKAVAERIRQRPAAVQASILAALDEWEALAGQITEPHREWLRAVLAAAEPADAWGRQVRAARAEKDGAKRKATLEALAASADVAKVPARALTQLAKRLDPGPRVALLRRAQAHYPADFWVNHNLGMALQQVTPPERDEAVRFLTAAVALRPESAGCVLNLGNALRAKGQVDDAIACFRKAVELDPKYAHAHLGLGAALYDKGRVDEAIACIRKAIELDPKDVSGHNNLGATLCDGKRDYDGAIACFKKVIELNPKIATAHRNLGNALRGKGQLDEAIACYQKAIALDPKYAGTHFHLGYALWRKGQLDEAIACYQKAIALDPKNALAHDNLGIALLRKGQVDGAIACWRTALALDPKSAEVHCNLGNALFRKGQLDGAIACYQKAVELNPRLANAHNCLGAALCDGKRDYDGAIASFRQAIALDPKDAWAHRNLGNALRGKGQLDEAIACYQKAIELDPKDALAHDTLGNALKAKGQLDEAIACYQKAIELDPKYAGAHFHLGNARSDKGQVDEAVACWRTALALDPKSAEVHCNLGSALLRKGQLDGAIACFRKAVELDPKLAMAHNCLGAALHDGKRDYDGAIACFRQAIALDPKDAWAHRNLGVALYGKGQVDEAIASYTKALALDPKFAHARTGLTQAERLVAVQDKLPAFLKGDFQPTTNGERLALAEWCQIRKLYRKSAGLSAAAFAADPELADDLKAGHRYNAARSAALAAAGQGDDAAQLDDKERTRLRQQARDWLCADLALRSKHLDSGKAADRTAVLQALRHWQRDSNLAALRDEAALAKLPEEQQKAFTQLWADVAALLRKAEEKGNPGPPGAKPPEK